MSPQRNAEPTDPRAYDPKIDDPTYGCTISGCPDDHYVDSDDQPADDYGVPGELMQAGEQAGPPIRLPRTITPNMQYEAPAGEITHTSLGTVFRTPAGTVHRIEWVDPEPATEQPTVFGMPVEVDDTLPADVIVLRSDSGEHAVIELTAGEPDCTCKGTDIPHPKGLRGCEAGPEVAPARPPAVRPGAPIGVLGLAQAALDRLTDLDSDELADDGIDGAQRVAARLARFGVRGIPGSCLMHPLVEHVLAYTGADMVRLADDGRALAISKVGVSAIVPLPAPVAEFVALYDGPDLFPYPTLYAVPSMVYGARAS